METLNTLTLDKAIEMVPAIGATESDPTVSDRYQFVSTHEVLERVQQYGWRITNATSQGPSPYAQHRITLIHEDDMIVDHKSEGIPRIEMFNSHNRTKRLMFAIGYFRFACSNGLIIATGPTETIRTKHRFSDDRLAVIMEQVSQISARFPQINSKINILKSRELSEEEQLDFVKFAVKGRFLYRAEVPKRFQDQDRLSEKLLASRRTMDEGNTTWQVYNRVQENLIKGIDGFSRPINGYSDSIRVNQLLWKGAETTLEFEKDKLRTALTNLLVKDGKKGKISA
jgi:hypothetical protein